MGKMKMIITDTGIFPGTLKPGDLLVQENGNIHACNGCMKCWDTTPGICAWKDTLQKMGELLSKTDELVIVSCCLYGTFSSFVQKVLERALPYFCAEYDTRNGKMFHKRRYSNTIEVSVYFYGNDLDILEKKSAEQMVHRLSEKLQGKVKRVMFVSDAMQIGGLA